MSVHGGAGGLTNPPPRDTWDTTGYGHQAGGTHPTGIHYCFLKYLLLNFIKLSRFDLIRNTPGLFFATKRKTSHSIDAIARPYKSFNILLYSALVEFRIGIRQKYMANSSKDHLKFISKSYNYK